jgi:hypothetical protein
LRLDSTAVGKASRRELIRRGLAIGAGPSDDAAVIARLISFEELAAYVYRRALESGRLTAAAQRLADVLWTQEREHLAALSTASGTRPRHRITTDLDAQQRLTRAGIQTRLAGLRDQRDWLRLLEKLERVLERAYYDAISRLASAAMLELAVAIIANEAQHATLLSEVRFPGDVTRSVPQALVVLGG